MQYICFSIHSKTQHPMKSQVNPLLPNIGAVGSGYLSHSCELHSSLGQEMSVLTGSHAWSFHLQFIYLGVFCVFFFFFFSKKAQIKLL